MGGGGGDGFENGGGNVDGFVGGVVFGFVFEYEAEEPARAKVIVVQLGEEIIRAHVALDFDGGLGGGLYDRADDHGGYGWREPGDHGGDVDHVEDGRRFTGLVHGFEECEEGVLIYVAGFEDGSVGSDETAFLVVRASLGDYYWTWEVACWDRGSYWVSCEKVLDNFVNVVLPPFFGKRNRTGIKGA